MLGHALAITGRGKIVRHWPMVPGIDFAGTVLSSADARFEEGDEVMLTGWGVGEEHWGGMAERAREFGGSLSVQPGAAGGACLCLDLPLEDAP